MTTHYLQSSAQTADCSEGLMLAQDAESVLLHHMQGNCTRIEKSISELLQLQQATRTRQDARFGKNVAACQKTMSSLARQNIAMAEFCGSAEVKNIHSKILKICIAAKGADLTSATGEKLLQYFFQLTIKFEQEPGQYLLELVNTLPDYKHYQQQLAEGFGAALHTTVTEYESKSQRQLVTVILTELEQLVLQLEACYSALNRASITDLSKRFHTLRLLAGYMSDAVLANLVDSASRHIEIAVLESLLSTEQVRGQQDRFAVLMSLFTLANRVGNKNSVGKGLLVDAHYDLLPQGDAENSPVLRLTDPVVAKLLQEELAQYLKVLALVLEPHSNQATTAIPRSVSVVLYKLRQIFQAVGHRSLADIARVLYLIFAQCRNHGLPFDEVHRDYIQSFADFVHDISAVSNAGASELTQYHINILQYYIASFVLQAEQPVTKNGVARAAIKFDEVALSLASSINVIAAIEMGWFHSIASLLPWQHKLVRELTMLHRGSAAVRAYPVEKLCNALLNVYKELHCDIPEELFPGELLWHSHTLLLEMLDKAAAWDDPGQPTTIIVALQNWQENYYQHFTGLSNEFLYVKTVLRAYTREVSAFCEQPVVLEFREQQFDFPNDCKEPLVQALQIILKTLILHEYLNFPNRRVCQKPSALTIILGFTVTETELYLDITDDGAGLTPTVAQVALLKKKLRQLASLQSWSGQKGEGAELSLKLLARPQ